MEDQQYFGDAIQFTLGSEPYVSGGTSPYDYERTFNSTFFSNEVNIYKHLSHQIHRAELCVSGTHGA